MKLPDRFTPKIIEELSKFYYSTSHERLGRFVGLSIDFAPLYIFLFLVILLIIGVNFLILFILYIFLVLYSIFHFYKIFVDSNNVVPRKYQIKIPNLKESTTFMFVSDMHYGKEYYGASKKKISKIIELINNSNTDLVILGGDFVCKSFDPTIVSEYAKINAENVIGVYGNHDSLYLEDHQKDILPNEFLKSMEGSGIKFLNNEGFKYNNLYFGGVTDIYSLNIDIEKAFKGSSINETKILISHNPDIEDLIKKEDNISLVLSGHTHGGQILMPILGPVLPIPCRNKNLIRGLYKLKHNVQLFISQGAGFSSTRMRLGTVCEVCEITLLPC